MKIAFFTLNAYDMLTGGHKGDAVGGAQLQQILIGKELAKREHDIYFVEYDSKTKTERTIDGIHVVTKQPPAGSELSRAYTVLRGTKNALDRINPDVTYRRSLDFEIFALLIYGSRIDSRFVYGVAHDDELTDSPRKFKTGIKATSIYRRLNEFALSNADAVITQNPTQYQRGIDRLNTNIYQIPNCYQIQDTEPINWECESPVVFWAARFQSWKQPEIVIELAEMLPDVTFVMAGGPSEEGIYEAIEKRAANIGNVKLLGHLPFSEIDRYFAAADLFLNTSEAEGFPNTFLQAWAQETPVVSLQVDPNSVLTEQDIGLVADGSIEKLRDHISKLSLDTEHISELGVASRLYLESNHTVEAIADQYEEVFFDSAFD